MVHGNIILEPENNVRSAHDSLKFGNSNLNLSCGQTHTRANLAQGSTNK